MVVSNLEILPSKDIGSVMTKRRWHFHEKKRKKQRLQKRVNSLDCAATPVHWELDPGGVTRCWKGVHCLSAVWYFRSVHGRLHVNNRFAASAVTCAISQLCTSSKRKLSLSATRQPFTVEIALLYVFSLSHLLFSLSFLRLYDRSHMQEQAGSMPLTQAVAPSPSHNRDGSEKVRMFDKRPIATNPTIAKDLWASCGYATLNCAILSKYEQFASARRQFVSARRQIGTGLYFFRSNLCRFRSKFAWALPLSLSLPWTMNFFLRNEKYGQEVKISSKCPTSAITLPHVKYVKGC